MPTKIDTTAPPVHVSHWIETRRGKNQKEEIFFRFETEWRGEAAFVTVSADKYVHSSGWSEWRIYATEVRKQEWGQYHTDTAKTRMSEVYRPVVEAWLKSDAYTASRQRAFEHLAARVLEDLDHERDIPSVYRFIEEHRLEMTEEFVQNLDAAACAFAEFRTAVKKVTGRDD